MAISRAHQNGIITLRNKMELKDLLLSQGSQAVLTKLAQFPGAKAALLKPCRFSSGERSECESKTHVLPTSSSYSITMYTLDARMLAVGVDSGASVVVKSNFNFCARTVGGWTDTLHQGSRQVLCEPNAGGNSFHSEALSFEVLQATIHARNLVMEMQVEYQSSHGSMVDFVCQVGEHLVGVSVTRAMHFLGSEHFTPVEALVLLEKKLGGLFRAKANVTGKHQFDRQILHVFAQGPKVAQMVKECFLDKFAHLVSVCCLITVCEDVLSRFVFFNQALLAQPMASRSKPAQDVGVLLLAKQLAEQRRSDLARQRLNS